MEGEEERYGIDRKSKERSPVVEHFHIQYHEFYSHVSLCCIEHGAQWSDNTRKVCESYWIRRLNTIQLHGIDKGDLMKNGCVSACGRLTSGRLRTISERWVGSRENTMKLCTFHGLTQVGYATQRTTFLVGAVCDYLDLLFLSMLQFSSSY